jgi:hypothetical protein
MSVSNEHVRRQQLLALVVVHQLPMVAAVGCH